MEEWSDTATRQCPVCHASTPQADFCGFCGASLRVNPTFLRKLLRPKVYVAAPRQPVGLPLITSTLFPRLAQPYRRPFQHGLILIALGLVVFALLRLLVPLIVMTTLGLPLLFLLYLWQSDARRTLPVKAMVTAAVVGFAVGAGWWLWASEEVARAYGVSLAAAFQLQYTIDAGFLINNGSVVMMAVPAVVVRLMRMRLHDSLDGFLIGALGALFFFSASTLAWRIPQFTAGLLDNYGGGRLLEDTFLYAVADPLTTVVIGGLVGSALWFKPRSPHLMRRVRPVLVLLTAAALAVYYVEYYVDGAAFPRAAEEFCMVVLTALALVLLRTGIQIALLHEAEKRSVPDTVRCGFCGKLVPGTAFCVECGGASRAAARWREPEPADGYTHVYDGSKGVAT